MKDKLESFNKEVAKHQKLLFAVVGGILALTVAFALGRITAPVDVQDVCKTYIRDTGRLEGQLETCSTERATVIDQRLVRCQEAEREACEEKLERFREACENLACQESR